MPRPLWRQCCSTDSRSCGNSQQRNRRPPSGAALRSQSHTVWWLCIRRSRVRLYRRFSAAAATRAGSACGSTTAAPLRPPCGGDQNSTRPIARISSACRNADRGGCPPIAYKHRQVRGGRASARHAGPNCGGAPPVSPLCQMAAGVAEAGAPQVGTRQHGLDVWLAPVCGRRFLQEQHDVLQGSNRTA